MNDVAGRFRAAVANLTKHAAVTDPVEDAVTRALEHVETTQVVAEFGHTSPTAALSKVTLNNLFQHPDAHPYVLDLALLQKYGPEWFEFEPETLRQRILHDFPTSSVSDLAVDKLNAMKCLHYVDSYWKSWEVFVVCTMALNGMHPDFQVMQVPTVAQCAVSVDTANQVRTDVDWSDEMKAYFATVFKFNDMFCPVAPLDFVTVDAEHYPVDVAEILKLWPLAAKGVKVAGHEGVMVQLEAMLSVQKHVDHVREQLTQQLKVLHV